MPDTAQAQKKYFWAHAKLINTRRRGEPSTKKYQHKFDIIHGPGAFRGIRWYKDQRDGEIRKAVEIAI